MKNPNISKMLSLIILFVLIVLVSQPVAAQTIQQNSPTDKIPYFRYPVSYEVGEGVDYSVGSDFHKGADLYAIDFVYPTEGMDIYPTLPGRIVYSDCIHEESYGCTVVIRHWDDNKWDKKYYSLYAHLQPGSMEIEGREIQVGDLVDGTKPIGKMGKSGKFASGIVHLHFAVRVSDIEYGEDDPRTVLFAQVNSQNVIIPAFNVRPYLH